MNETSVVTTRSIEGETPGVGWELTKIDVKREYVVSDAPDLQDDRSTRRLVIRPRRVTLYQVYSSLRVRGAVIEGRQVRRDGGLGGDNRQILAGLTGYFDSTPPNWLNALLDAEGLEWEAAQQ